MNHNLKLNDAAAETLQASLTTIAIAVADLHRTFLTRIVNLVPAGEFDEMRAPLGSITDARWIIDQLVFRTDQDDSDYGIDTSSHPSQGNRRRVRMMTDEDTIQRALSLVVAADPVMTNSEAAALIEPLPCDDDCSCHGIVRPAPFDGKQLGSDFLG
jgi:hypothetical protein